MIGKKLLHVSLLLAAALMAAAEEPPKLDANANNIPDSFDISFAWWCAQIVSSNPISCSFRAFADIGGVPCLIDTGSSTLAFCDEPAPPNIKDVSRAMQISTDANVSQCIEYGGGSLSHGFFGDSYHGNVSYSSDHDPNLALDGVIFTVMEKMVGESGNACGPAAPGSRGMKDDQSIGGIWGVASAALNNVVYSDDMDQAAVTWEGVPEDGQCNATAGQCQCPQAFTIVNDSLLQYLVQNGAEEWAISWDGSLGDGSGKMLFGDAASAALPVDAPKVPLDFSDGFYRCNVTAIEVDGATMNQDGPISYIFDTGTPQLTLPPSVASALQGKTSGNVVFYLDMINGADGEYATINTTITLDLFNAKEFEIGSSGSYYFFGLPLMRYLDNVVLHFGGEQQYFMGIQREVHITDPPPKLPLTGDNDGKSMNYSLQIISLHDESHVLEATYDFLHSFFMSTTFDYFIHYSQ